MERWDNLNEAQLNDSNVWEYVDPTDGEFVRPRTDPIVSDDDVSNLLFSTRFVFRNGLERLGFIHGVRGDFVFTEKCFGALSPFMLSNNGLLMNLFAFPAENWSHFQEIQIRTRENMLGFDLSAIYPLSFMTLLEVPGVITSGSIPGLMFYRIMRKRSWVRSAKSELMTVLPEID